MRKDLLLLLADELERDANNPEGLCFDYTTFLTKFDLENVGLNCNTRACALGFAALSDKFPELSIVTYKNRSTWTAFDVRGHLHADPFIAAAEYFKISKDAAELLFAELKLNTNTGAEAEREVAKEIRAFVASHN